MASNHKFAVSVSDLSKVFEFSKKSSKNKLLKINRLLPFFFRNSLTSFSALNSLSFDLKKNDSLGIIGMNGAGKSTLLQIIAGIMKPSSGNIKVNGKVAALLELGSGFSPDFTGEENVYLNASLFGLSKPEIDSKFNSIVKFSEIEDFINQPVRTYSSGMLLRLAFAVVAHVDADILIIDEALSVGDIHFTQKCMNFIREFKKFGTLILVTHDHVAVQNICAKCLWLEKGKLKEFGNVKEVTQNYLNSINEKNVPKSSKNEDFNSKDNKGVKINNVQFLNDKNSLLVDTDGNQMVSLRVEFTPFKDIQNLGVGFMVKNSHGLELFGKNTFDNETKIKSFKSSDCYIGEFNFLMPILPIGKYTISVAIAEYLDSEEFIFHEWIEGAVVFSSSKENSKFGMVGIPVESSINVSLKS